MRTRRKTSRLFAVNRNLRAESSISSAPMLFRNPSRHALPGLRVKSASRSQQPWVFISLVVLLLFEFHTGHVCFDAVGRLRCNLSGQFIAVIILFVIVAEFIQAFAGLAINALPSNAGMKTSVVD